MSAIRYTLVTNAEARAFFDSLLCAANRLGSRRLWSRSHAWLTRARP
jgi:hypothetical protein